jgi:hypothetical protein|tara:strand:- start:363 stop:623 length:261 start_codon:yes stop_codon:yes gene_type:complete
MLKNNIDKRLEDVEVDTIKIAGERKDPDQILIDISPDIFEQLQDEYYQMQQEGYTGSYADFLRSKIRVTKANGGLISNYKIQSRRP